MHSVFERPTRPGDGIYSVERHQDDVREQRTLAELGGTAKLVIDVVSYDNAYHRAMLHSLGDCVVCDTHAEAKKLAYDKSKKNAKRY